MIIRTSRRKLQYDTHRALQPAFDQLHLPWLCPALLERCVSHQTRRKTATIAARVLPLAPVSTDSTSPRLATVRKHKTERGYAFAAVDEQQIREDAFVPFEDFSTFGNPPRSNPLEPLSRDQGRRLSDLPPFDPSSPVILNDSILQVPRRFRDYSYSGFGVEIAEIHQNFRACLQVGKFERAAAAMRRLNSLYKVDAPELVQAHNEYIGFLVDRLVEGKDQKLLRHLQRWFEVDICAHGILPDATTFTLMVEAAFQDSNQLKLDRTIRRYIELAERAGLIEQFMAASLSILSDQQLGRLTRIAPMSFYPAEEIISVDKAPAMTEPYERQALEEQPQVPEVRPKEQKGLGLTTLKKSLASFSTSRMSFNDMEGTGEHSRRAHTQMRQERLEEDVVNAALERWHIEYTEFLKKGGVNAGIQKKSVGALMWSWHEALIPLIKEHEKTVSTIEKKTKRSQAESDLLAYSPYLQLLPPEKISAITIIYSLNKLASMGVADGLRVSSLVMELGKVVEEESMAEHYKKQKRKGKAVSAYGLRTSLFDRIRHRSGVSFVSDLTDTKLSPKVDNYLQPCLDRGWSVAVRARIGALLVSFLMQAAKIDISKPHPETGVNVTETVSALWTSHRYSHGKLVGVVHLEPSIAKKLTVEPVGTLMAKHLPTLQEPVPWTALDKGGYINQPVEMVRLKVYDKQSKQYLTSAIENGDMDRVLAGLDVLGSTPWRINRKVFDVMLEVWNTGEAFAKIPAENPQLEYPPEPSPSDDVQVHKAYMRKLKSVEHLRSGLHSERCFQNFQLEVARAYLNETFYLPHNVDFRGRAYPLPPYLNHLGSDNCRGILLFGRGRKLGEKGLMWLQIHLANVFGYDKASLPERQDFAVDHLADISDSANNPLTGDRWWLTAEDPWQCLATCMELKSALDSPDPSNFVSYLPVHQDGTCNGLQHYAALGGDPLGAQQVNLLPGDRPSDIYTAVAEIVKKEIAEDAAQGNQTAIFLDGKISRKIVKPTVMTNVYGVTYSGAKRQVRTQLEDVFPDIFKDNPAQAYLTAAHVASKIFKALGQMFNGAQEIQYWLAECASRICSVVTPEQIHLLEEVREGKDLNIYNGKASNEVKLKHEHARMKSTVIWTTPLRMPVVQPYRKSDARSVRTNLQWIHLAEPTVGDPVSKRKQVQAFPPNFIHSLDATHMLLSALTCHEKGLTFASVHDSFWTHAGDVETMNMALREAFVNMHSEDIIGRLATEFKVRYKDCMYLASVKTYSPVGKAIRELRAGKVKRTVEQIRIDELLAEKQRLRLLASENPAERAEGEAMITPSKLFADLKRENDLVKDGEKVVKLGDMSTDKDVAADPDQDEDGVLKLSDSRLKAIKTLNAQLEEGKEDAEAEQMTPAEKLQAEFEARQAKRKASHKTYLWLPISFPPVPKKGAFDVSRLKESKYFFS